MVQRMESNGFVTRRADEHDQRISRVYLTEKGSKTLKKLEELFLQLEKEEIDGFSPDEIEQLMDYLERINNNLKKHIPHHQDHKQKNNAEKMEENK